MDSLQSAHLSSSESEINESSQFDLLLVEQHKNKSPAEIRDLIRDFIRSELTAVDINHIKYNDDIDFAREELKERLTNLSKFAHISLYLAMSRNNAMEKIITNSIFKVFHISKNIYQLKKYGSSRGDMFEDTPKVKKEYVVQKVALDLKDAFSELACNESEKIEMLRLIFDEAGFKKIRFTHTKNKTNPVNDIDISGVPLWENRDRSINIDPAKYIRIFYESYMDKNITWGDVKRHDIKLYGAYKKWEYRHPNNADVGYLSTKILTRRRAALRRIAMLDRDT